MTCIGGSALDRPKIPCEDTGEEVGHVLPIFDFFSQIFQPFKIVCKKWILQIANITLLKFRLDDYFLLRFMPYYPCYFALNLCGEMWIAWFYRK